LIPRDHSWLAFRKRYGWGIIDANITHWTEAEVVNGSAILIVVGYGLPQLQA
jgi:hypothetical protein